jgi:thiol-disulfide isomerase/thioredoxin
MSEARIRAPELPESLQWFNTSRPLTLEELRGRVVLLDFWTYCCINCMHVLADLKFLEDKYGENLTVIGLHSPKFPNERVGAQLQKAINRHHIRHPVANDPKFQVWRSYAIKAWPSILVIDPEGYVVGVMRGEGRRQQLDDLIHKLLGEAEQKGLEPRDRLPLQFQPEQRASLTFPGKVYATENTLYIADTGRNRILETYHNGTIRRIFGSNTPGFLDGNQQEAAFDSPQGMVKVDDFLYVADTGNHAIRRIELKHGEVETFAGTGVQGRYVANFFAHPTESPLNSPWDLAYAKGVLYVAMAGQHQVWAFQLAKRTLEVLAGSGREDLVDGELLTASLAQPSGLAMAGAQVYLADAETSAIRVIDLEQGSVRTLVGKGLFEFGDEDGPGATAKLQHPLGVCLDPARKCLWIADTFNSKIKLLSLSSNQVSTLGLSIPLDEPGGLHLVGDSLFVADTNHHRVIRIDLKQADAEILDIHE